MTAKQTGPTYKSGPVFPTTGQGHLAPLLPRGMRGMRLTGISEYKPASIDIQPSWLALVLMCVWPLFCFCLGLLIEITLER